MNPQLQNPGMAIHPPNLYLGYVATAIPFAFAIAALFTRRLDAEWLGVVRRWALLSWFFLTIGIVLGMWWAYVELGWSGYWAWDPVENSSFLPWLTTTAFLHSIMIQEKRGMLRKWNVVLVVVSFLLAIFGTFITRSGVIESVHSFAQSPVGPWFATFFFLSTGISIYLVGTRLQRSRGEGRAREHGEPRGGVPVQQSACSAASRSRCSGGRSSRSSPNGRRARRSRSVRRSSTR